MEYIIIREPRLDSSNLIPSILDRRALKSMLVDYVSCFDHATSTRLVTDLQQQLVLLDITLLIPHTSTHTMFTPPNPHDPTGSSSSSSHAAQTPPAPAPRRRALPPRSSLSNSYSFAPITPAHPTGINPMDSSDIHDGDASFSLSYAAIPRTTTRIAAQGNRGIAQVSPRVRPSSSSVIHRPSSESGRTTIPRDRESQKSRSRLAERSPDRAEKVSPRKRSIRGDDEMDEREEDEDEEKSWGMVDSMRLWRHDAIMQHLYDTAAFWGDKILSWTGKVFLDVFRAHL